MRATARPIRIGRTWYALVAGVDALAVGDIVEMQARSGKRWLARLQARRGKAGRVWLAAGLDRIGEGLDGYEGVDLDDVDLTMGANQW